MWINSATCLSSDKGGSMGERADTQSWRTPCKAAWQAYKGQSLFFVLAQGESQLRRGGISHLQMPGPARKPHHHLLKQKQHLPRRDTRANSRYSFSAPSSKQLLKVKEARQAKCSCRTDPAQRTRPGTLLPLTPLLKERLGLCPEWDSSVNEEQLLFNFS